MINLPQLKKEFSGCPCKMPHTLNINEIVIGSGIVKDVGEILKRNVFKKKLLLVADENTMQAASGITGSIKDFDVKYKIYKNLREASVKEVAAVKELLKNSDGILAVGTGSIHDISRKAAAELNKPLCLFATAPSMDGFASYNAPLTDGNFKITYPAKSPEVIIGDTRVLAAAPKELKSAGFGDMVGKYVGLIDWQVSSLITGEYFCEKVAALTRSATDKIMTLCDRITAEDEESASAVFEALLLTGIGMSFTKTSRPASGTEHILSHFWECKKLLNGELSDYHGKKVGVATLLILDEYGKLYEKTSVKCKREVNDWEDILSHYGALKEEVIKLNFPETITDGINPLKIEENWGKIRKIISSVPTKEQVLSAMKKAGCAIDNSQIAVTDELKEEGLKYHPYMRKRLSLYRLKNMIQ